MDLGLRIIKSLHAQWLVNIYNYFTTASSSRDIFFKGLKKGGISRVLDGSMIIPPEDPFMCIRPFYVHPSTFFEKYFIYTDSADVVWTRWGSPNYTDACIFMHVLALGRAANESVDSLCRDGANTPICTYIHTKAF